MRSNRPRKNGSTGEPLPIQLFGRGPKDRYLVGVASHGPIRARELGRLEDIDPSRLPALRREFSDYIKTDENGRLQLAEDSPVHDELAAVLNHLAGRRLFVLGPPAPPRPMPRRLRLFGGALRTRVLISVGLLAGASLSDVGTVAQAHPRMVRYIGDELQQRGIVVIEPQANERIIRLASSRLTPVLQPLLDRLATPQMRRAAAFVRTRAAERNQVRRIPSPVPLPIGTEAQAAVLWSLLSYGPGSTAQLARDAERSKHVVRSAIDGLVRADLVVTKTVGAGPGAKRWVGMNQSHPVVPALQMLVAKPAKRGDLPPAGLPVRRSVHATRLPGMPLRTETFVRVTLAGAISIADLAKALRQRFRTPLRGHAAALAAAGLVEYGLVGGVPTVRALHDGSSRARIALAQAIENFNDR